jgi:hypothetical protein
VNVTLIPPAEPKHSAPSFDLSQFAGDKKHPAVSLTYADREGMHNIRTPDPRKGRRLPTPAFALSDELLQEAVVRYCEHRFLVKDRSGSLKERMQRCSEAALQSAQKAQTRCDHWIKNFRAISSRNYHEAEPRIYTALFLNTLRGESPEVLLKDLAEFVSNWDASADVDSRAPQVAAACAYLYWRLNWDSPTVALELRMRAPAVRQLLRRIRIRAEEKVPAPRRPRVRLKRAQIEELLRLHKQGESVVRLAERYGMRRDTTHRMIRRENRKGSNV